MNRTTANLLLLTAGAVWGMGFVAQQTAMDDIGPLLFVGLRFLLAGLAVLPFALRELARTGSSLSTIAQWRTLAGFTIVGTAFFLGMSFQQFGLVSTSVTNAGFLTALYVVLVPLILVTVVRRPQPAIIWPAAGLALGGIYMLSGGNLSSLATGDFLIVICALFWAIHVIMTAKVGIASGLPVTMACYQFFLTGVYGLFFYALMQLLPGAEPLPGWDALTGALPEIIYAGLIAGGFAFTLQAIGQRHTSESAAAILLSTESLFAALFGALFLDERLSTAGYAGCTMIFIAILIVELLPSRRKKTA